VLVNEIKGKKGNNNDNDIKYRSQLTDTIVRLDMAWRLEHSVWSAPLKLRGDNDRRTMTVFDKSRLHRRRCRTVNWTVRWLADFAQCSIVIITKWMSTVRDEQSRSSWRRLTDGWDSASLCTFPPMPGLRNFIRCGTGAGVTITCRPICMPIKTSCFVYADY